MQFCQTCLISLKFNIMVKTRTWNGPLCPIKKKRFGLAIQIRRTLRYILNVCTNRHIMSHIAWQQRFRIIYKIQQSVLIAWMIEPMSYPWISISPQKTTWYAPQTCEHLVTLVCGEFNTGRVFWHTLTVVCKVNIIII